jgi:hypothetical protein
MSSHGGGPTTWVDDVGIVEAERPAGAKVTICALAFAADAHDHGRPDLLVEVFTESFADSREARVACAVCAAHRAAIVEDFFLDAQQQLIGVCRSRSPTVRSQASARSSTPTSWGTSGLSATSDRW